MRRPPMLLGVGATRIVDRLEEAGLVRRETSPTDRRVTYAATTEAGQALFRRSMPVFDEGLLRARRVPRVAGNRESAQEELDRAAARTAIVSFHFSNGRPRELGRSRAR